MQTLASLLGLLAALLFLGAAYAKLKSFHDFRRALLGYRLLPESALGVAGVVIVGLELAIGAGALLQQSAAFVAAQVLLVVYAVAMAVNLARGRAHIDCGCGGEAQPISGWLVGRNLVMAGALAFARPVTVGGAGEALALVAGCVLAGFVYAAFNQLVRNAADLAAWR